MPKDIRQFTQNDWFAPAVLEQGSVSHCLEAVESFAMERIDLIKQIKTSLVSPTDTKTDRLTLFGRRVATIQQTIKSRCEILRVENTQAWFRVPVVTTTGPFQKEGLRLSVFGKYNLNDCTLVSKSIKKAWYEKNADVLLFDGANCLWGELIRSKKMFYDIIELNGKYDGFTLLDLVDKVDESHMTDSFRAFLNNVSKEVSRVSTALEATYDVLWAASEKFWVYQGEAQKKLDEEIYTDEASRIREAFKKRREGASRTRQTTAVSSERKALKLMGLAVVPSADELKKKYRELARVLHPDAGGDEARFKDLTEAYQLLVSKISNQVEYRY